MRRSLLLVLVLMVPLAVAGPASAAKQSRTRTPVKIKSPAPANASVAGFELDLVKLHKKKKRVAKAAGAALAQIAAGLPKNVSVYAVVAKQKRSDRVKGVLVATNRASAVHTSAAAHAAARKLTINLKHGAVPKGYKLNLKLAESDNVLGSNRLFHCAAYFKGSDLAGAQRLGGPGLPGITIGTIFQSACASARTSHPYPTLGEFRYSLNASAGALPFVVDPQFPNEVDGNASFNYPVKAFGVLADKGRSFSGCAFAGGTCAIQTVVHAGDYAFFTLTTPAPAGTQLPFALAISPSVSKALPFQFFGVDESNHRDGPLLTSGP